MRLLRSTRTWILAASASVLAALAGPLPAAARPEYTPATGQACATCHVNPAGGGPRNSVGLAFAAIATHAADPAGAWAQIAASQPAAPAPAPAPAQIPSQLPRTGGSPLPGPEGLLGLGAVLLGIGALARRAGQRALRRRG